jgi:TetR/AcrR family transcriptional regulator
MTGKKDYNTSFRNGTEITVDTHYTERYIRVMSNAENILKQALLLFARDGYENTGIQKIVKAAEITKPTLYHYFGSKQGVLEAIFRMHLDPFLEKLENLSHYDGDITVSLEEIAAHYFEFAESNMEFYRFFLAGANSPRESELFTTIVPRLKEQFEIIQMLFKSAEVDHGNMKDRSARYAITFLGMMNSYITTRFIGGITLDRSTVFTACKQFMHGIFS